MSPLFLSAPAMLSSLGEGILSHWQGILGGGDSPLAETDEPFRRWGISPKSAILGRITAELRPFPTDVPAIHRSRNNHLLWQALQQIEGQIYGVIEKYGAARIATVIGSSTTGADENIPLFKYAAEHNDWSAVAFNQQQQLFSAPADFIAHRYGLHGLCYGISTACTSGARALISAARLLRAGLCDAVICGGVDSLSPLTVSGFGALSVLSARRTNPLSANRAGINIGEGAAVFIMTKEMPERDSVAFLGYGSSSDAYHMSSPHPEGAGAIEAFERALGSAALEGEDIGWINLHGTGTLHNDRMESIAVHKVFGPNVYCTSTKAYHGHTLGAAGALEAAMLWAAISRTYNPEGRLPPQLWDKCADPQSAPLRITDKHSRWPAGRRIAASSSFAFGGNNTVLILGEKNA
ncbi:beta-ketoacyl-ACP synthase [Mesocricetibacter intestinalis]|uniref:beta-ketoacyl-ACP synthase n=1 Tax=Mesocricetibacter intestinalis TaxID=1521930 RepID=UPI0010600976|nr:beta-ketoacyl-ACP synthase [Mesocricetibacter intestinalis]